MAADSFQAYIYAQAVPGLMASVPAAWHLFLPETSFHEGFAADCPSASQLYTLRNVWKRHRRLAGRAGGSAPHLAVMARGMFGNAWRSIDACAQNTDFETVKTCSPKNAFC